MPRDEHGVRAGEVEAEVGRPPSHRDRVGTTGQQRVEHLPARRLLLAGEVVAGQLEALGEGRHRVVRRAQHGQPRGPDLVSVANGDDVELAPQPPAGREVQVDQRAQRDPGQGCGRSALTARGELGPAQPPSR